MGVCTWNKELALVPGISVPLFWRAGTGFPSLLLETPSRTPTPPKGTLEQAFAERRERGLGLALQHCRCLCNPEGVFFPPGPISYQSCPLQVTRRIPCLEKKKWRDLKYLHSSFQQPHWLCENSGSQKLKQKCCF